MRVRANSHISVVQTTLGLRRGYGKPVVALQPARQKPPGLLGSMHPFGQAATGSQPTIQALLQPAVYAWTQSEEKGVGWLVEVG